MSRLERAERYLAAGRKVAAAQAAIEELEKELAVPPFPRALNYVWRDYIRLRKRKSAGFNGVNRIEWPDINSFLARSGSVLTPWEISLIEDVDDIFCKTMSESAEPTTAEVALSVTDSLERQAAKGVKRIGQKRGQ